MEDDVRQEGTSTLSVGFRVPTRKGEEKILEEAAWVRELLADLNRIVEPKEAKAEPPTGD